jgi:hypothetical protein
MVIIVLRREQLILIETVLHKPQLATRPSDVCGTLKQAMNTCPTSRPGCEIQFAPLFEMKAKDSSEALFKSHTLVPREIQKSRKEKEKKRKRQKRHCGCCGNT